MSTATLHPAGHPDPASCHQWTEEQVRARIAEHVVATLLPPSASDLLREGTRTNWTAALKTVRGDDPQWAMAYLPGTAHDDNDTYALHLPSGRVFGGNCDLTTQQRGESTGAWLARLESGLDTTLADYQPRYIPRGDG